MAETCQNCGTLIGALETAHLFKDHIVCTACNTRLTVAGSTPASAQYSPPPPPSSASGYVVPPAVPTTPCPVCSQPVAINARRCIHCGHLFGVRCPTCGQPTKPYYQWYIIVAVILLFPLGLLLLLLPRQGNCRTCGVEFNVPTIG